jgi:uncharacterized protein YcfJ
MNPRLLQLTSALCALSLFSTGCANIKDDQRRTKTEGALAGGVLGAVAGGALGYALGGRSGLAAGAVTGAAVGGAGGYAYGSKVAAKKKVYASNEEKLRAMISEARSERQSAESYNSSLRRVIAQQRSQISQIASSRRSGQNVRTDASKVERNISANLSDMNKQLERRQAVASEVKTTLSESPSGSQKQQLQAEYDSLQKEKAILSQQISEMNGLKKDLATASR